MAVTSCDANVRPVSSVQDSPQIKNKTVAYPNHSMYTPNISVPTPMVHSSDPRILDPLITEFEVESGKLKVEDKYVVSEIKERELLNHPVNVLATKTALVKKGRHIVEDKTPCVSKGVAVNGLLIDKQKTSDFLLFIEDNRSNEDVFKSIEMMISNFVSIPLTSVLTSWTVSEKSNAAKNECERKIFIFDPGGWHVN